MNDIASPMNKANEHNKNNKHNKHNEHQAKFMLNLRQAGVIDKRILEAMESTPRVDFIPKELTPYAFDDEALPIGWGQTISQPSLVATIIQKLNPQPNERILEVGTGSGYQTTILSKLCRWVYSVERLRPLLRLAKMRFEEMKLGNVSALLKDGYKGWQEQAPFDKIIVSASSSVIPPKLCNQLKEGGRMILPLREDGSTKKQRLVHILKNEKSFQREDLGGVAFVPLLPDIVRTDD